MRNFYKNIYENTSAPETGRCWEQLYHPDRHPVLCLLAALRGGRSLQHQFPNPAIKLHCAIPCKSQADKWEASLRDQYHAVLAEADSVIFVNREWTKNCMLERNRFMVDRCSIVLAVYNGEFRGGTAATVRYARKMGREIFILNPSTLEIVHEGISSDA